jgi:hypothetical protein
MTADSQPTPSANGAAPAGLPPVTPPSGRFIAQLFLVPGMIVLMAVLIILAINYLFVGGYTPAYFLGKLDSDNADIRWRGASDLAQWIKRKESQQLKTDTTFALDLAERLRAALDDLKKTEADTRPKIADLSPTEQDKAWRKLAAQRNYVDFLTSALGDFYIPVGVPLLCEMITQETAADVQGNTMRRRRAIWALANLGANTKAFAQDLKEPQQQTILADLHLASGGDDPRRAGWARTALFYLEAGAPPPGDVVLVDRALAQAAGSQDRYLREHVAMALNFWDGDQVEPTLLRLARDDGFGTLIRVDEESK